MSMPLPDDRIPKQVFCGQQSGCSHPLSAPTHKTARTGSRMKWNARRQSNSSKTQESRFSRTRRNVQSARGRPNLPAISASGRVTAARGFATPESGSTLTVSCTDDDTDIRSVDLDGAVQTRPDWIYLPRRDGRLSLPGRWVHT